eukprot:CAMPEP_0197247684 /NCGR_PEP_ID=MMETSP1429-20130617/30949_1 /TAXON_ID=49237 /ORGANISM="Chaetoceros  sp., Strain UNC1202" /LENGTH=62 /DNA_ID=CAMNT_0042708649 /DNA_START=102 /DNA_END=290 /DNA_ORIENTATION=+
MCPEQPVPKKFRRMSAEDEEMFAKPSTSPSNRSSMQATTSASSAVLSEEKMKSIHMPKTIPI